MTFDEKTTVDAVAPFDFDLTSQIFQNGDKQIRTYQNAVFSLILKLNDQLVHAKVSSIGTIEKPKLAIFLKANKLLTSEDKRKQQRLSSSFSI